MQTQPVIEQIPRSTRIPDAEPERSAARAKAESRVERPVERTPVKAETPVPVPTYGAGF